MSGSFTVSVVLDRGLDIATDVSIGEGSPLSELKELLAAGDPTGSTKASDIGLGLPPATPDQAVQPLPSWTRLTSEHARLCLCQIAAPAELSTDAVAVRELMGIKSPSHGSGPAPCQGAANGADMDAREAARESARRAQAARKVREEEARRKEAEEEARKRAQAEAIRQKWEAQAQHTPAGPGPSAPHPAGPAARPVVRPPSLAGVLVAEDTGETKVKGVSADGRYVFAYVGGLRHPHDVIALIDLFKGEASVEDLHTNKARFVYAGGTQDKATSVSVQREVIIETAGLEKGDYELASFPHDNMKKQLNRHLTKDNCVVMFGGKALKIEPQHAL